MLNPFFQSIARHYCMELAAELEDGDVLLRQLSAVSEERRGQGLMLGALVCTDGNERLVLYAVSGISRQLEFKGGQTERVKNGTRQIIVPPIVAPERIEGALAQNNAQIHYLTSLAEAGCASRELLQQRRALAAESLQRVFSLYEFTRFDSKKITLDSIIAQHKGRLPPTGTGDCTAPKLLSYAFARGWRPVSMNEFFYGRSTPTRMSLKSYAPCDARCGYILPSIMGLSVIYRDSQLVVVNKPSGLLSVPGRGLEKRDSVAERVRALFPVCIGQPSVHRLDEDTSGLLVLALTESAHRNLCAQFEKGQVHKKYIALLDGLFEAAAGLNAPEKNQLEGELRLRFRLDLENRPHQVYDEENGKLGVTRWRKLGTVLYKNPLTGEKKRSVKLEFTPLTGRTHQLRLASADMHGFGLAIIGDSLYGRRKNGETLQLYATELSFLHPVTSQRLTFTIAPPF